MVTKNDNLMTKKFTKNLQNVHNLFIKNLQKIHNFWQFAQKKDFSGKKFVHFDDAFLLDNFSIMWYTGISALQPPGARQRAGTIYSSCFYNYSPY